MVRDHLGRVSTVMVIMIMMVVLEIISGSIADFFSSFQARNTRQVLSEKKREGWQAEGGSSHVSFIGVEGIL